MSLTFPVPKRNRRMAALLLAFLFGTAVAAYLVSTRLSALIVLRWFVEETGIPVEIKSASWQVSWRELLREGKIESLQLVVYYKDLDTDIEFTSPVDYNRDNDHWSIKLEPTLAIGNLPPARGTMTVDLSVKRYGRQAKAEGAAVEFHLRETMPLTLETEAATFAANSWKLDGTIKRDAKWKADVAITALGLRALPHDRSAEITAKTISIRTENTWGDKFPLPLFSDAKLALEGLTVRKGPLFIEEPRFEALIRGRFDGHAVDDVHISVDNPVRLRASGALGPKGGSAAFELTGGLKELFADRVAPWFESRAPLLRRVKAKGDLSLKGSLSLSPTRKLKATARLKLAGETLEFPSRDLFVDGLALELPLEYPEAADWGNLTIRQVEYQSVKLKNLALRTRIDTTGVDVTTEDAKGADQPIRQSLWGGAIDVAALYVHLGFHDGTQFTSAVRGGPFELSAVQADLCMLPKNPLSGSVTFDYPKVVRDGDSFELVGDTNLTIFNGNAHIGDLFVNFAEAHPRLRLDLDWSDLDLHALGDWTKLGDMRGSLHGFFKEADISLLPEGPVPHSYELEIRGTQRGGNKMSFYGRAIDNILQLVGTNKDEMPWYAKTAISITSAVRNWLPAKAEVLGFKAKVNSSWTELSTHDPPQETDTSWCDPKKHYLLCGTGFTIPLNAHGVYPVIMKTPAFHEWLNGRVEFVQQRIKKARTTDEKPCTPFWE